MDSWVPPFMLQHMYQYMPPLMDIQLSITPSHTQSTMLSTMPPLTTPPQLTTSQPQYTTQPQLLIMPQSYTNQLLITPLLSTNQLPITNQPMMAQLFTNMAMLFKMTTPRLTLPPIKTVTVMLSLVNTVLLFPMAVPKLLPTPL